MTEFGRIYVDACLRPGSGLGEAVGRAALPAAFEEAWRTHLLPRPWFVREAEAVSFARDVAGVFDLLVSLPERLFGGDVHAYAAAVGLEPRRVELLLRGGSGRPERFGRADAYHDGERYRLLELNLGSEVGGLEMAVLGRRLLAVPEFADFAGRHGLAYVDIAARVAAVLRERARPAVAGGREPVIGLIEGNGAVAAYGRVMRAAREAMAEQGLELLIGEVGEVRARADGKLTLRGTPLDLVLRNVGASQLLDDPAALAAAEAFFRAHEAGATVLFTSLESGLFAHKNALALLSAPEHRGAFDAGERALVERVLPWSRVLGPELVELCRERRERLILKPGAGYGGLDTFVGWECAPDAWERALKQALETGGYVAQERVVPRPEPVYDPVTGEVGDWIAALGFFLTEDGYAGAHARVNRVGGGAIVGLSSNPGTRMTGVFSHP